MNSMIVIEELKHLNVPTSNIEESVNFYTMFFDFDEISKEDDSAEISFENIRFRLFKTDKALPTSFPLISFSMDIDDFTDALQFIEKERIKIVSGPVEIASGEKLIIADPSGNLLELYYVQEE